MTTLELSDEEARIVRESLSAHADLMYDMGAEEEMETTVELMERLSE